MSMNLSVLTELAPLVLLLFGLAITVATDPYIRKNHCRLMLVIIALCFSLIAQDIIEYQLSRMPGMAAWRVPVAIYGYSVRPVVLILFLYIIRPGGKRWLWWVLAGVNAALYLISPVTHLCFTIIPGNHFVKGPLWFSCTAVSGFLLAVLFIQTVRGYREAGKKAYLIPIFVVLIIVASTLWDFSLKEGQQQVSSLNISMVVGSVFYYIWLHLQFVREHEQDLMAQQRIRIMMSQIQPHFLFNTIATFKALCRKDPDKAADMAEKLGQYLRQNLDSLDTDRLIPFDKELEHTRLYAEIEMTRFENIRVEYDIQDHTFWLPPLTVQPIVENAIRHGVRIRKEGRVLVSSRLAEGFHEIVIRDNGTGFDVKKTEKAEGTHIGIRNVRERLEKMCGASFTLESKIGEGTTAVIRIPQGEKTA